MNHHEGFWARLRRTGEGRILAVGIALWIALIAELLLLALWDASVAGALARGAAVEIFGGRETGIPIALHGGAPAWLVAQVSFTQDIAAVCLAYPLFLWMLHRYHDRSGPIMRRVRRLEAAASRHETFVRRWGPLGLFVFMLVPFLVNGPLIGGIVGRLAGIHTRWLYAPVLAATAIAAVAWTFAFEWLFSLAAGVDRTITAAITAGIVLTLFGLMLLEDARASRRERRLATQEREA